MGFFKEFKDDFSQAVNELMPGEDFPEENEFQVNTLDGELDVEQELSKLDGLLEQVEKKSRQKTADVQPEPELRPLDEVETAIQEEVERFRASSVKDAAAEEPAAAAETVPEVKAEPEAEAVPEVEAEPEAAVPEAKAEPEAAAEPETLAVPEVEAEPEAAAPEAKAEPEAAVVPEATTVLQDAAVPEAKAEPEVTPDVYAQMMAELKNKVSAQGSTDAGQIQNTNKKDTMKEEKIMDTMDTTAIAAAEAVSETAAEAVAETAAAAVVGNEMTDEVSVITAGTSIKGNMEATGSFEIEGRIEGDIKCNGKLTVIGSVIGNSVSSEFFADAAHIEGEVVSSGTVKVGLGSVIIGNLTATSAVIAGAVKGDIDVQGPVVVDTSAVIMGNIKSRSVQINNGAVIEGFCSQSYSDVDVESLFAKSK